MIGRQYNCVKRKELVLLFGTVFILIFYISLGQDHLNTLRKGFIRIYGRESNVYSFTDQVYIGCDGNFLGFGHQFALLNNVLLQPNSTAFYIPCKHLNDLKYSFEYGKEGTHLNSWMTRIKDISDSRLNFVKERNTQVLKPDSDYIKYNVTVGRYDKLVVAVQRYEYANLYHTMTDWYNVFLVATLVKVPMANISVLLMGNKAHGHLEATWTSLFGPVLYSQNLSKPTQIPRLAWSIIGYESPINYHGLDKLPFLNEFVNFFLRQHSIQSTKQLNCDSVSILFLWRRDYIAHSNNPTGSISRKIKNEEELIEHFSKLYPRADVKGVQLDTLSFKEQLEIITQTDILLSMHGAGLSHILFLPPHAGVVEMFPTYWLKYGMNHFRTMARWKGLHYQSWQNFNPSNEFEHSYTYIPPQGLNRYLSHVYNKICS